MSRSLFFTLVLILAVGVAIAFSIPAARRDPRALARRFAVLMLHFLLFTGVGWVTLRLSRLAFSPGFPGAGFRGMRQSSIPFGLPAVAFTSLLCGVAVLIQYRKQEKLTEKLAESERSRTGLLKDLAHDVRSPMTALRLIMDGLRAAPGKIAGEELIDRTGTAIRELGYLQSLVDSLLLLAQLEDPDFGTETSAIAPLKILHELIGQFQDFPDRLHLRWDFQSTLSPNVTLRGNRILLDRALRNAFENASRYARERIEIRLAPAAGGTVELTIRDDGPGFTPDALAGFGKRRSLRIVDTSAPSHQSLGLGSAILCSAIRRMGGTVSVANHPQGGAEVRLRLVVKG